MKVYNCVILVLVTIILVRAEDAEDHKGKKCGQHEEWNACGIPEGCVRTCDKRNIQIACIDVCTPGCFCKKDSIRKYKNGPCIPKCDCPKHY